LEGTLSPELVYPTIVETVAQTLKLPYVEITVPEDTEFKVVESFGKPESDLVTYPLTHQGEVVGQLCVARRTAGEDFNEADDRLLRSIAQQAGTAVHAAHLTDELQDSRRDLVTAREEERRRLRRDLHDGLGPQLASQTLGLDAALKLMDSDPQAAKELMQALSSQNQDAVLEIRQLVYGLRPPALDELGLVGALRESSRSYEQQGLKIDFDAPQDLPDLPAAVEVAAYRIIQEALTNVARHAGAKNCQVRLAVANNQLEIEIKDDGHGLPPDNQPGVGLLSMRERAAELSGRCLIESPAGGGTRVFVQLPL
jgi:signal transduction histidine kinase